MKNIFLAMVACILAAGQARADDIWVGYDQTRGTMRYPIHNMSVGGFDVGKRTISHGLVMIGGTIMRSYGGNLELGVAGSVGVPTGSWTFNQEEAEVPPAGFPNRLEGDQMVYRSWTVPLMARVAWGARVGPGRISLSASAGYIFISSSTETKDQLWADSAGGTSANKMSSTDTKYGSQVEYKSDLSGLPIVEIAPSFRIRLGESDSIGIEVPVTYIKPGKISGKEETLETPVATQPNPYQMTSGVELGGITVGARAVWSRKF
jgi:hypothetical protein